MDLNTKSDSINETLRKAKELLTLMSVMCQNITFSRQLELFLVHKVITFMKVYVVNT